MEFYFITKHLKSAQNRIIWQKLSIFGGNYIKKVAILFNLYNNITIN